MSEDRPVYLPVAIKQAEERGAKAERDRIIGIIANLDWREEFTLGELCELLGLVEKGGG